MEWLATSWPSDDIFQLLNVSLFPAMFFLNGVSVNFVFLSGGGFDRQFKLWNLKTPYSPITSLKRGETPCGFTPTESCWNLHCCSPYEVTCMSHLFPGIPTEIQWIPSFGSIVSSEEDSSQIGRCPNVLRKISFMDDKLTMSYHNSTIWVSIWIIQPEVNSWRWAKKFQGISTKKIFLTPETSPLS